MARILGVGGIFFKSPDPVALCNWYADTLGLQLGEGFNGAVLDPSNMPPKGHTVWSPFKESTTYFEPSAQRFMFNFIVDDLVEALAQVRAAGAETHGQPERSEFGAFGWFTDPDGNKVELWQPDGGPEQ